MPFPISLNLGRNKRGRRSASTPVISPRSNSRHPIPSTLLPQRGEVAEYFPTDGSNNSVSETLNITGMVPPANMHRSFQFRAPHGGSMWGGSSNFQYRQGGTQTFRTQARGNGRGVNCSGKHGDRGESGTELVCPCCLQRFTRASEMTAHMQRGDIECRGYISGARIPRGNCGYCSQYASRKKRQDIQDTHHGFNRDLHCKVCHKNFKTEAELAEHKKRHRKCSYCKVVQPHAGLGQHMGYCKFAQ